MSTFIYAATEMMAWLLVIAILFGTVFIVLVAGALLDEGLRSGVLWLKSRPRMLRSEMRATLRPAITSIMLERIPRAGITTSYPRARHHSRP